MGTAASLPYDEETLKKLRGVVTMRFYDTQPEPAIPMKDGVEMVFECATENQVIEVPQTVLPMVYGRGHEASSFHGREPPVSDPSGLAGGQEYQERNKTLDASIQARYQLDNFDKDAVGYMWELPPIHPLHIDRRQRARLLKSEGNLARALERTDVAIEVWKRRELEEQQKKKDRKKNVEEVPPVEPAWDEIQPGEGPVKAAAQTEEQPDDTEAAAENGKKNGTNTQKPTGAKTETKEAKPQNSKEPRTDNSKASKPQNSKEPRTDNSKASKPQDSKEPRTDNSKASKPQNSKEAKTTARSGNGTVTKERAEEVKPDLDKIAEREAQMKNITFEKEEREREIRRNKELQAQRTQERLLHIINNF